MMRTGWGLSAIPMMMMMMACQMRMTSSARIHRYLWKSIHADGFRDGARRRSSTGCSEGEVDHDGDGICDASALSPDPSVCTGSDNYAEDPNPDQSDSDGDGPGDACDSCPTVESDQRDLDEDGLGDDLRPRCRRRRRAKRSR